jgi:putative FmdB family regulatory protein
VLQREFRRFLELPLYEYECPKDGTFELVRKFSDEPLEACPTCGGPIEKLASAPAIQFKGSGWYITDYARKSTGGEAAGKKEGSDKGGAGDSAKDKGGSDKGGSKESSKESSKDSSSSSASESKSSTSDAKSSSSGSSDKK